MDSVKVGVDIIEIERMERALERRGLPRALLHRGGARVLRLPRRPAQSYAARFAGKEAVGKALGCGVRFTWKEIEIVGRPEAGCSALGPNGGVRRAGQGRGDRPLDDALARDRGGDRRREPARTR